MSRQRDQEAKRQLRKYLKWASGLAVLALVSVFYGTFAGVGASPGDSGGITAERSRSGSAVRPVYACDTEAASPASLPAEGGTAKGTRPSPVPAMPANTAQIGPLRHECEGRMMKGTTAAGEQILTHVCGAVVRPGVYRLSDGAHVALAIQAAGGFREEAAGEALNQAALLENNQQVYVPTREEWAQAAARSDIKERIRGSCFAAGDMAAKPVGNGGRDKGGGHLDHAETGAIDVNQADKATLMRIPGVGDRLAEAILRSREEQGPFQNPEDLMRVNGIKEKKLSSIREHIRFG